MPAAKRSAFAAGLSDSDNLSDGESQSSLAVHASKKPKSTSSASKAKGGASGTKTVVAPARRAAAPAATPVVDDSDDDDSSSSPSSQGMGQEIANAMQAMLEKQQATKKKHDEKEERKAKQLCEAAFNDCMEQMQQCRERHAARFAKDAQAAEKLIAAKRKAVEKEQAQFFDNVQKLEQEIAQTHKQTIAGQRKMTVSIEDFKNGATRIVKDHETQCDTLVKKAHRDIFAEADRAPPFDDIFKAIARTTSKLEKELPSGTA